MKNIIIGAIIYIPGINICEEVVLTDGSIKGII